MTFLNGLVTSRVLAVLFLGIFQLAVPNAQAGNWANEPAGFQSLTSWPFDTPTGGGWTTPFGSFAGTMFSDGNSPVSPTSGIHNYRSASSNRGGDFQYVLSSPREFFMGFAVRLSNPHYGWFNSYQKLALIDNSTTHMYLEAFNVNNTSVRFQFVDQCALSLTTYCNTHVTGGEAGSLFPNNTANPTFADGTWHKIEIYYKASSTGTSKDGAAKLWVDGMLLMNYSNLNLNTPGDVWIANIWDSLNTSLPQQEWIDYDHVYISSNGGGGSDASAPAAPTGLKVF